MPKIIKDLEKNIFNAALDLFGEYGYTNVDMKMIAKKVGIAVGTLYNYYPNKNQLFIRVFQKSWKNTFDKMDNMIKEDIKAKEKAQKFINILYDDIQERKGLGRALTKSDIFKKEGKEEIIVLKNTLLERMSRILKEIEKEEEIKVEKEIKDRISASIILMISLMIQEYPNEKEQNIEFINKFIQILFI
ncbi:TetR/AcrR family transcriptional regulator [Haloimpatiens sp. FM7330]|uniref:TetR/AcrR family transcriptional regulator n=1 Tax=Haloimpatiens sp. FM7330 TaxID=3298610 RepID=UPI003628EA7A